MKQAACFLVILTTFLFSSFVAHSSQCSNLQIGASSIRISDIHFEYDYHETQNLSESRAIVLETLSFVDDFGQLTKAEILNYGKIEGLKNSSGKIIDWEDFQIFKVKVSVSEYDSFETLQNQYVGILCWPSKYLIDMAKKSDDDAQEPATIQDLITAGYNEFATMPYGYIGLYDDAHFGILNGESSGTTSRFNSKEGFIEEASKLKLSSYNPVNQTINIQWNGTYHLESSSTSQVFSAEYGGEAFISGIERQNYSLDFDEIHIFNGGECSLNDGKHGNIFNIDFSPVNHYLILAHNEFAEIKYQKNSDNKFDYSIIPSSFQPTNGTSEEMICFRGNFYTNPTATDFYREYVVQDFTFEDTYAQTCLNTPLAGTMIPGGYDNEISDEAGTCWYFEGNYFSADAESVLTITADRIYFTGCDLFGNEWNMSGSKCYLHYDSSDYSVYKELHSGIENTINDDSKSRIICKDNHIEICVANDCCINIYATTGAILKQLKASKGQQISINLNSGLYIVEINDTATKIRL